MHLTQISRFQFLIAGAWRSPVFPSKKAEQTENTTLLWSLRYMGKDKLQLLSLERQAFKSWEHGFPEQKLSSRNLYTNQCQGIVQGRKWWIPALWAKAHRETRQGRGDAIYKRDELSGKYLRKISSYFWQWNHFKSIPKHISLLTKISLKKN